jgi:transglutaminase-like putative cysteine protease
MRIEIVHKTRYHYDKPLSYALQQLRLTPRSGPGQTVVAWDTTIEGGKKELRFEDHNENHVELVSCESGRTEVVIISEGEVKTNDTSGIVGPHTGETPLWYFKRHTELTAAGRGVHALLEDLGDDFDDEVVRLHALSELIAGKVRYEPGRTHAGTTAEAALEAGHGVCQDHSHLFIASARVLGYPARYVSGYLQTDEESADEASHAWAEVFADAVGWIGFDISNGISPDARYVRVATGLDYREAAPIHGMLFGNSTEKMEVSVQVQQ